MGRMAIVHETTMWPTKLELLTQWLLTRSWYVGGSPHPSSLRGDGETSW
ncbi:MAG TPA: hypothetical protein VE733_02395 [Streptosporangiaceae bacterium]|jgi:hypothetical protein|nr:hypothetical protein [Streptosporangiaceae bacterium]